MDKNKTVGYWIGFMAKVILAVAMLLYLGMHSYNFFTYTFKGEQWLFAILGLFTTSIGFLLWIAIYLYAAEDGLEKAVCIVMMFVSLFGEFAVAGFDMYMSASRNLMQIEMTADDIRNMSYIIAGLALLNGLALVAGVAGQQIMEDLSSVKFSSKKQKSNVNVPASNVNTVTKVMTEAVYPSETNEVTLPAAPVKEAGQKEVPFRMNGQ